ncbi:MAG: type II toxin-antitoxin system YoeB family toxin [Synergistaceae bacterium]|nr:type II toxin-antitoxin system YoeB family toxin [Synergistaceae bacterium]
MTGAQRPGYFFGVSGCLKHDLSEYWSVKIDEANRLIFKISGSVLKIAACRGSCEDD